MTKTIWDLHQEAMDKYGTRNNTFDMFPVGTEVKIITPCEDFNFFYGETGKVVRNHREYLGIIVEFDAPRHFEGGYIQKEFNFNPQDLHILKESVTPNVFFPDNESWVDDWM